MIRKIPTTEHSRNPLPSLSLYAYSMMIYDCKTIPIMMGEIEEGIQAKKDGRKPNYFFQLFHVIFIFVFRIIVHI
jgi:hypothetical protein